MNIRFAIITCSDTRDLETDEAGAALEALITEHGWSVDSHVVVRDDAAQIKSAICRASDGAAADIVLTCGGTGLSPRDVTPEATRAVCERDVPGIAEAMRAASMEKTRRAMLSRAVCMQRFVATTEGVRLALVINLPGSTKAATECFEAVCDQFEHAMKMTAGKGH